MSTAKHLDELLAHYLSLLHTYTTLRAELNTLTSQLHSHLARANFLSGRGRHYGQLDYDERMQATLRFEAGVRGAEATDAEGEMMVFAVHSWDGDRRSEEQPEQESVELEKKDGEELEIKGATAEGEEPENSAAQQPSRPKPNLQNAALRQFATLPPQSLRQAQSTASQLIKELVPKLAAVDAEMRGVEIDVRRARKRARKAEAGLLEKKVKLVGEDNKEELHGSGDFVA